MPHKSELPTTKLTTAAIVFWRLRLSTIFLNLCIVFYNGMNCMNKMYTIQNKFELCSWYV